MLRSQLPIVKRTEVLDSIVSHQNLRIILIGAPAGYGKTVLANQIAQSIGGELIIHRVTVWQRDVANLHQASLDALNKFIFADSQTDSISYTDNAIPELMRTIEAYDGQITYLLDDLHYLLDYQKAEQWLQNWLDHMPQNMTLILSGREIPPLSLASFIHRNEIVGFGIENLTFTVDELRQSNTDLSFEEASRLVSQFDGWIAGIKLALTLAETTIAHHITTLKPDQLFQELLISTFNNQAPDFQSFLMLSSTLDTITEISCREILGLQNVTHHLNRLHAQQLFINTGDHGTEYHDLFRTFLQDQLRQYDRPLYLDCHRRVAEWHHAEDQVRQAIVHYVEAEQYQDAARLSKHIAHSFLIEGQKEALIYFHDIIKEHSPPELLLYCGIIYMERRNFEYSQDLLTQAQELFVVMGNDALATRASIELAFNEYREGNYVSTLEKLETLEIPYPDMEARRKRLQGLAYLESGQFDRAIEFLNKALDDLTRYEADFGRSNVLQDLSEAYLRSGNIAEAGKALKDAVALKRKLGNMDDLALTLNNLGHFWYRTGSYDDAIATLEEGLDMVSSPKARATAYLYWTLADVYRALGMYSDAERYYESARKSAGNEGYLYVGIMQSFAMMRCMQGYWHDAEHILNHSRHHANSSIQAVMSKLLKNAVQVMLSQYGYEAVDSAIIELHESDAKLKLADGLGLYLLIGWQSGRTAFLERGIRLLKALESELWHTVASFVVKFPQLQSYLGNIAGISRLKLYCEQLQPPTANSKKSVFHPVIYDVSIYTFGQDNIMLNGRKITNWTVSFARELFIFLLLNGAKNRYDLQREFWADRDIDQAMASFHTTRNRIRKALGEHAILYQDHKYFINPVFNVTIDSVQFEDFVTRAIRLPLNDARSEDLLHRAVQLYQGEFLPQFDRDWVVQQREYYQGLYVDALVRLAENCELRVDYYGAIAIYEKAISKEPFTEKLYRQIMLCWARIGRRDMVKITFEHLVERLQSGIQMKPSREMQNFYNSLFSDTDDQNGM
ncbi:MAG: tetratricopeptide repeat protein [Anaerolineae bacterium]